MCQCHCMPDRPHSKHAGFVHGDCGCGCGSHAFRRFISAKEQKETLEAYKDQLQKELEGVEERLTDLSK